MKRPTDVIIDQGNRRVIRWTNENGKQRNQLNYPIFILVDSEESVHIDLQGNPLSTLSNIIEYSMTKKTREKKQKGKTE